MANDDRAPRDLIAAALQRSGECPSEAALARYVEGASSEYGAHIQGCLFCSAEVELLKTYLADVPAEDAAAVQAITQRIGGVAPAPRTQAVEKKKSRWPFDAAWLRPATLVAAGLLVMIAIGLQLRRPGEPSLANIDRNAETYRAHSIKIAGPIGDLQEAPLTARWEEVPLASQYQARLLEVDGHELWSATTSDVTIQFPREARALMVPAKTLVLSVTALSAAGKKLAESEDVRFKVLQNVYPH
jgi:hypothetical protein